MTLVVSAARCDVCGMWRLYPSGACCVRCWRWASGILARYLRG